MNTTTYRYRSSSLSRHMVSAIKKHLSKIGVPQRVVASSAGSHNGWYRLTVIGSLGRLHLNGCSWGYRGEGCHATKDILVMLGVSEKQAEQIAFQTPNTLVGTREGKGKVYFDISLVAEKAAITHGGTDYRFQLCKCSECGAVHYCTPQSDFYVREGQPEDGLLVCESCIVRGISDKPMIVLGTNPLN